jgi:surface carbohydrate biosynthesis protein
MNHSVSTLIIPVETQVREMDAKILLSCVAAERGFPVIIGSRAFVHYQIASFPRGIYLAKSLRTLSMRMFNILRQLGHEIIAWDEEGLLRWPDPEYYRQRLSPITIGQISHLLAWGPDNARVFRDYPGYKGTPIHITGNPRIDLMRPELREYYHSQVTALRERYGDFVLVNTNFGLVNHFYPELGYLKKAVESKVTGTVNPYDAGKGRHKLALFHYFQEMLPKLCAAVPGRTVVLRPHPSENQAVWHAIAERCPNLRVINEGSVTPWVMAARAVIANGCTTLIEAAVLDTPAVAYQPVTSEEFDDNMPNALSHRVFSLDELCAKTRAIIANELGPFDYAVRRKILDQHIAALDGPLAAERMVAVLEAGEYNRKQPPVPARSDYIRGWVHTKMRTLIKRINMRRPGHRNNAAFHDHRFPKISVEEIVERINRLGRLMNRFESIRVRQHSRHIFKISSTLVNGRQAPL